MSNMSLSDLDQMSFELESNDMIGLPSAATRKTRWRYCYVLLCAVLVGAVVCVVVLNTGGSSSSGATTEHRAKVQLVGGEVPWEGRVEVYNGAWGTVCSDAWDVLDANVVCRGLGYAGAADAPTNAFFGEGSGLIVLDDLHCLGDEDSLLLCPSNGWGTHDCLHRQDASVVCATDLPCGQCPFLPVHMTQVSTTFVLLCNVTGNVSSEVVWTKIDARVGSFFTLTVQELAEVMLNNQTVYGGSSGCGVGLPEETVSAKYVGPLSGEARDLSMNLQSSQHWEVSKDEDFPAFVETFVVLPKQFERRHPSTPAPTSAPCLHGGAYKADTYLKGLATRDGAQYTEEEAYKKCLEYEWACTGITCTGPDSCTVRSSAMIFTSPYEEYTCLVPSKVPVPAEECIAWRQTGGCVAEGGREPQRDLGCDNDITEDISGYCQCGVGRTIDFSCRRKHQQYGTCSHLCAMPPFDECTETDPCGEAVCIDPNTSPNSGGDAICVCKDGFTGIKTGAAPDCSSIYHWVDEQQCPQDLFPIDSAEECLAAAKQYDNRTTAVGQAARGGCIVKDDTFSWGPAGASGEGDATICTSNEMRGGLRPAPRDYLPGPSEQVVAVQALLRRVLDSESVRFQVNIEARNTEYCILQADGQKASVTGSSVTAVCKCIYTYMKQSGVSVAWGRAKSGYNVRSARWGHADIRHEAKVPLRYSYNTCTFSYTMAWWGWERWQQELDWLALRGVNLPLAFVGQEYIWKKVFSQLGLTDAVIHDYFGGAAFLAWRRMGNLEGWAGPLTADFINKRHDLQLKILDRMKALGMMPVLPAFSGYVPQAVRTLYPDASYTEGSVWNGFSPTLLLQPSDPLFVQIAEMVLKEQRAAYGWLSHYYNADTFNEMLPESKNTTYLAEAGLSVLRGIQKGDPHGKWIMQGWLFTNSWWDNELIEAYLSELPREDILILDLNSDAAPVYPRTEDYFHTSYVWCLLHNFGGRPGVYGNVETLVNQATKALERPESTMAGMGITMEATQQNPIMYDVLLDHAWSGTEAASDGWVGEWVASRYGNNTASQQAWRLIVSALYSGEVNPPTDKWVIYSSPNLYDPRCLCSYCGSESQVHSAWSTFLDANQTESSLWRRDLAVFTGLVLQTAACRQLSLINGKLSDYRLAQVTQKSAREALLEAVDGLLGIYSDLDDVLGTDMNLQLACWLEDAGSWGADDWATELLRAGARNQVTLWGADPDDLNDYAKKSWSGLVKHYYRQRWVIVRDLIAGSESSGGLNWYEEHIRSFELEWNSSPYNLSACAPSAHSIVDLATGVRAKYYPNLMH